LSKDVRKQKEMEVAQKKEMEKKSKKGLYMLLFSCPSTNPFNQPNSHTAA
jgi:hypothetical protein